MGNIKGVFFGEQAEGQNIFVYLCTLDLSVFSGDILDLLASKGCDVSGVSGLVDVLGEELPEMVTDVLDVEEHLMKVSSNAAKFPLFLTDPALLSYSDLPGVSYLQRTGLYKLKYITFRPIYKLVNESTLFEASLAYCGFLKAYYVKQGETQLFFPVLPTISEAYNQNGFRGVYPTSDWASYQDEVVSAFNHYALGSFYGVVNYLSTWYEGGQVEYWHLLSGQGVVTASARKTSQGVYFELNSVTNAPFNADYPITITEGWLRSWSGQTAKISKVQSLEKRWFSPAEDGVILPPLVSAGFGGVLAAVFGIATKTGLLDSVWRKKENA
jgi:hypothetical protein